MKLLLIDGNSILNRAFYGIKFLSTSKGVQTNALYGFINILLKHIKDEKPDMVAVAYDLKQKTFRHQMYEGYKGTRHPHPPELINQIELSKQFLECINIHHVEKPGIEADDIIGIYSHECTEKGYRCVIVTGDRDSLQLVDDNVSVKLAGNKADELYTPASIFAKYNLKVDQLIDLKALQGDSSDNIPGIPGVGPTTATKLLQQYSTLENVLNNADDIKGTLGEKIRAGKESALLSRELGTILRQGELPFVLDELVLSAPDELKLNSFLNEYELQSVRPKISEIFIPGQQPVEKIENETFDADYEISDLTSEDILKIEDLYIVFSEGWAYIKTGVNDIGKISTEELSEIDLKGKKLFTHDAKSFLRLLYSKGHDCELKYDTALAAYVLETGKKEYVLSSLFETYMHLTVKDPGAMALKLDSLIKSIDAKIVENEQQDLYYDIELPLCCVLADMEATGFKVDKQFLIAFGTFAQEQLDDLSSEIYSACGHEFNINSPKQLSVVLFEEMNLPHGKKTSLGYSTNNDELEKIRKYSPIVEKIILYRQIQKLKGTYVDGMIDKIDQDGRIHTVFTQTITQTGRISSTEPNLQNIPVRSELGRQLRHAFVADDGHILVDADYSQIELRILAHIANDQTMINAFKDNVDIHTLTASQVFDLPVEMVTPKLRSRAKAVNFGIVYGIGEFSLARDVGTSVKEAKQYIEEYNRTYKGVAEYMRSVVEKAKATGYTETLFKHKRFVPELNSSNKNIQALGQRIVRNTPIQGTAAEIIKIAMIRVFNALKENHLRSKLILQVHDELIVETAQDEEEMVKKILKEEMEQAVKLSVDLTVDVKSGKDWFEAH